MREIIAWHGGYGRFSAVDSGYLGTGEAQIRGALFYTSSSKIYARNHADYLTLHHRRVYLHKIRAVVDEQRIWVDPDENSFSYNGNFFSYNDYASWITSNGKEFAAAWLRERGVDMLDLIEYGEQVRSYYFSRYDLVSVIKTESRTRNSDWKVCA